MLLRTWWLWHICFYAPAPDQIRHIRHDQPQPPQGHSSSAVHLKSPLHLLPTAHPMKTHTKLSPEQVTTLQKAHPLECVHLVIYPPGKCYVFVSGPVFLNVCPDKGTLNISTRGAYFWIIQWELVFPCYHYNKAGLYGITNWTPKHWQKLC